MGFVLFVYYLSVFYAICPSSVLATPVLFILFHLNALASYTYAYFICPVAATSNACHGDVGYVADPHNCSRFYQ